MSHMRRHMADEAAGNIEAPPAHVGPVGEGRQDHAEGRSVEQYDIPIIPIKIREGSPVLVLSTETSAPPQLRINPPPSETRTASSRDQSINPRIRACVTASNRVCVRSLRLM